MSKQAMVGVLEKMVRDPEFRALVKADPATALYRADLTPDERAALAAWSLNHLVARGAGADFARQALGEDPRPMHRRLEPSDQGVPSRPTGEL